MSQYESNRDFEFQHDYQLSRSDWIGYEPVGQPQSSQVNYNDWQSSVYPPRSPLPEPAPPYGHPPFVNAGFATYEPPTYTVPDTYIAHQQHHSYLARQPTCWDPPWSSQTTAYQPPLSYEPDMYSPPLPRRRPTSWDLPTYWETPGQLPFHEISAYDQPLPLDPNSRWNQPYTTHEAAAAPHTFDSGYSARQPTSWQPRPATTAANPIVAQLERLLEACNRMESRLDAADRRIDNLLPPELPETAPPYGSQISGSRDIVQHRPPSGNSKASLGPSGLAPNDSSAPSQQPNTTLPFELPPYAAPVQPLQPLPVTAPLLASNRLHQATVPSSRKTEWEMNLLDGKEKLCQSRRHINEREEKLIELNGTLKQRRENGYGDENGLRDDTVTFLQEVLYPKVCQPSLSNNQQREAKPAKEFPFSLDPFQLEAIKCLDNGESIMVSAHTSASEVITDPIASCLVMITEILRSTQYKKSIAMAPRNSRFVFLSATVPNARKFADWVAQVHQQPCHIAYTDYRPTPLHHYIFLCGGDSLYLGVDKKGKFHTDSFQKALNVLIPASEDRRKEKGKALQSLVVDTDDEWRRSIIWCVFDPGGDTSPRFSLSTLFVASWFPP